MGTFKISRAARIGFLVCCTVWLVVLIVPQFRTILRVQLKEALQCGRAPDTIESWDKIHRIEFDRLAARYPNDVQVQAKTVEWRIFEELAGSYDSHDEVLQKRKQLIVAYDRLITRFPNDPWLIANRLRLTEMWVRLRRDTGELGRLSGGAASVAPPERKQYEPAELDQALRIARLGRAGEPDNSFYDWLVAKYLLMLYRDREALAVLHEGSRKARYDDHTLDDVQASLAVRQKLRPLLLEDKYTSLYSIVLPHLSLARHLTHVVVWQGVQAEHAGDHHKALQIYGDMARLGALMAANKNSIITAKVGVGVTLIAWGGTRRKPRVKGTMNRGQRLRRIQSISRSFISYAAAHGREDLAIEANRMAEVLQSPHLNSAGYEIEQDPYIKSKISNIKQTRGLWWAGVSLLMQLMVLVPIWLVVAAWLRRSDTSPVPPYDYLSPTLIIVAVVAGIGVGALRLEAGQAGWLPLETPHVPEIAKLRHWMVWSPVIIATALCFLALLWRYRKPATLSPTVLTEVDAPAKPDVVQRQASSLLVVAAAWALLLGTAASWYLYGLITMPPALFEESYTLLVPILVLSAGCFARWFVRTRRAIGNESMAPYLVNAALFIAIVAAWMLTFRLPVNRTTDSWVMALTALGILRLLYMRYLRLRMNRSRLKLMFIHGLCWYRDTIGACIVSVSVIYLLLLLWALPARNALERNLDTLIREGEVAEMQAVGR